MKLKERKEHVINRVNELSDRYILGELSTEELREYGELRRELEVIINRELVEVDRIKAEKSREMRSRRQRGKYGERRLAKLTGGNSNGRPHKSDVVVSSLFSIESKYLKEAPKWLQKIMSEAVRLARQDTIPVAYIRDRGNKVGYFIILEQDWISLHGKETKDG
uniref:Uncharacterized protein n=1 Tax=viral metagenome TaxID=1070528 RepID=A0A6M3XUC9_9ZZZZ